MLVSTILKDLASSDVHEVVICLTSLGSIMNSTIASAINESVTKLITHTTDLVRKKAILVLQKIVTNMFIIENVNGHVNTRLQRENEESLV